MISQKDLQKLDMASMEEYYNYILECQNKGNDLEVEQMTNVLGKEQKRSLAMHLVNSNTKQNDLLLTLIQEL